MQKANDHSIRWYVIGCLSVHKEVKTRDDLRKAGFESYVPMRYEVKTVRRQQQRLLVPAITGLVFARGSLDALKQFCTSTREPLYVRKSTFSGKQDYLTVEDRDMEQFIRATEQRQENVTYFSPDEINLHGGEKIRVKGGIYDGLEGTLIRVKGKRRKQLVVQIPGVVFASIELAADMVEVRGREVPKNERIDQKTKNLEADKRQLYDTAYRLLFVITDKYQHENEYFAALVEMKRLRERIARYKGYTAATEGELALALYMANVKLGIDVEASEERMKQAISKLQTTSLLRLKMQLILAKLSKDQELEEEVVQVVKTWNKLRLSPAQQAIVELVKV